MYLRNVTISDFRAFPTDFSLDLTPGPGLTLIVGQNGLGKSTFFEALEWCLTGEVKRLRDLPTEGSKKIDFLARRRSDGTEADRYGVELIFQPKPDTRIGRWCEREGTGFRASFEPDQAAVIKSLKSPAWQEPVSDLGAYLRLTHFLSQSGEQRFAAQDSKQRWSALEAPAGTERLNRVRQRLGNKGVTAAFNRRRRSAEEQIRIAEAELDRWNELLDRRESARKIAESGGALSPSELLPRLELLWLEATPVVGELRTAGDATIEDRLQYFGQRLEMARPAIFAQLGVLRSLDDVTAQWRRSVDDGAADSTLVDSLRNQLDSLMGSIDRVQESISEKDNALKQRLEEREQLARQRFDLIKLLETFSELQVRRADESAIIGRIEEDTATLAEALSRSLAAAKAADDRRLLEREFAALSDRQAAVRELRNLYSRWSAANSVATRLASRLAALSKAEEGLEAEAHALEQERIARISVLRDAEQQLEKVRFQATAIEAAVASIASVLTEQDTQCPLCASTFPLGELKKLASSASGLSFASLASAEDLVETQREAIRTLERDIERLQVRKRNLEDATKETEAARAAADALNAALRLHPIMSSAPRTRCHPTFWISLLQSWRTVSGFLVLREGHRQRSRILTGLLPPPIKLGVQPSQDCPKPANRYRRCGPRFPA